MSNSTLNPPANSPSRGTSNTLAHIITVAIAVAIAQLAKGWFGNEIAAWALGGGLIGLSAGLFMTPRLLRSLPRTLLSVLVGAIGTSLLIYLVRVIEG